MKHQRLHILFFLLVACAAQAQTTLTLQHTLQWAATPGKYPLSDGTTLEYWKFEGCTFGDKAPTLPVFAERFALPGRSVVTAEITAVQYESFTKKAAEGDDQLGIDLQLTALAEQDRSEYFGWVRFVPIRKAGSGFERAVSFTITVRITPEATPVTERGGPFTTLSALNTGTIYKFGVAQTGIYKLDYSYLKNQLGITDLDNIDPRTLRLYGNGGKMLPERNIDARPDDLIENAIQVVGEADGKFDQSDYILFYAQGPAPWSYRSSPSDPEITIKKHLYDANAWYFLKTGDGTGQRVTDVASVPATFVSESFDDVQRKEDELVNLLDFNASSQGSGKRWFGDYFFQTREKEYSFDFPNVVEGSTGRIRAEFAGRSAVNTTVLLTTNGTTLTRTINGVAVSNNESSYAANTVLTGAFQPASSTVKINLKYPQTSTTSEGWLDYIEVNVRRRLAMAGSVMEFRDIKTIAQPASTFRITDVNGTTAFSVWNITNPQAPGRQTYTQNGSTVEFGANTQDNLRSFVAFFDDNTLPKPEVKVGKIPNQNLHGTDNVDMAIIYHPEFQAQAAQLAQHRKDFSGLNVVLVDVNQLYNEFSSGAKDVTAIRDFARMVYDRNPAKFQYLLLFGDGSFDPKNNTNSADNLDFIPVFETAESFSPISGFPSDDFIGLLGDTEGNALLGALDIAIGRLTARNAGDAQAMVDKIISYDKDPASLGDWRLRQLYIGDDDEGNVHSDQADKLANEAISAETWFNVDKVYFDAYQQVATSGGQRYPDAKAAINADIFKGNLVTQYIGHGGPRGWAQERVVDQGDIAGWENPNRYPLIVTATCSFGGFDDYTTLTGGEQSLVKEKSGAVALFTTVRAVYIYANEYLTNGVQDYIFQRVNGQYRSIGNILRVAKNNLGVGGSGGDENSRRFTLLGDPAMFLALPKYRVATTKVSGHAVVAGQPDTLKALMPVELEGMVTDQSGTLLGNFNGKVTVSIFDKVQKLETLGQDDGSLVRPFTVQRNVIFKGSATVTNGLFKISFIVPKDINYAYGAGKISYYAETAENGIPLDAAGGDRNIIVGGNANIVKDDQPPLVQAFLNTDAFALGGITNTDPKILVKCSDDYGMNVSGSSLGHDLTAILDDNVLETIVLNDFYESAQDNYRKGQAVYPLRNIAPGRHKLRVKGWDIANNPGEGYTEFVVAEDGKAALDHVLNYPNPFTTNTNFQFEHNLAGQQLDVQVSIFSVSGKLVKTIIHSAPTDGFRVTDINWNGRDEYGDPLARGVYLYRVKVRGTDLSGATTTAESDFEKLVILK